MSYITSSIYLPIQINNLMILINNFLLRFDLEQKITIKINIVTFLNS